MPDHMRFLTRVSHGRRSLTRTSASSDATPVSSKATSPSQIQVDEARDKKMALYAELFELDVSGDVRRHAAKQVRGVVCFTCGLHAAP